MLWKSTLPPINQGTSNPSGSNGLDSADSSSLLVVGYSTSGTSTARRSVAASHVIPRTFASGEESPVTRILCSSMFASWKISFVLLIPSMASSWEEKEIQMSSI